MTTTVFLMELPGRSPSKSVVRCFSISLAVQSNIRRSKMTRHRSLLSIINTANKIMIIVGSSPATTGRQALGSTIFLWLTLTMLIESLSFRHRHEDKSTACGSL